MLFLIETHGPSGETATQEVFAAACLAQAQGRGATVLLIQEGVMHALRAGPGEVDAVLHAGIPVLVDRFSLVLRGIDEVRLPTDLRVVDMPAVVDLLGRDGVQPLWH
jgi:sulfur relay (sulfurtransferase) DsrF/TusC family protein